VLQSIHTAVEICRDVNGITLIPLLRRISSDELPKGLRHYELERATHTVEDPLSMDIKQPILIV
jgi:hypothetical protein